MSGAGGGEAVGVHVDYGIDHGDEVFIGDFVDEEFVEFGDDIGGISEVDAVGGAGVAADVADGGQGHFDEAGDEGGADAVSGDIGDEEGDAAFVDFEGVVEVAAEDGAGEVVAFEEDAVFAGESAGEHAELDGLGELHFLFDLLVVGDDFFVGGLEEIVAFFEVEVESFDALDGDALAAVKDVDDPGQTHQPGPAGHESDGDGVDLFADGIGGDVDSDDGMGDAVFVTDGGVAGEEVAIGRVGGDVTVGGGSGPGPDHFGEFGGVVEVSGGFTFLGGIDDSVEVPVDGALVDDVHEEAFGCGGFEGAAHGVRVSDVGIVAGNSVEELLDGAEFFAGDVLGTLDGGEPFGVDAGGGGDGDAHGMPAHFFEDGGVDGPVKVNVYEGDDEPDREEGDGIETESIPGWLVFAHRSVLMCLV